MKIGDSLLLVPKFSSQTEKYRSKILEISDHSFFIEYPINILTHNVMFLIDGTQLQVSYTGEDGSIYEFDTVVIGRMTSPVPMVHLKYPEKVSYSNSDESMYMFDTDVLRRLKEKNNINSADAVKLREFVRVETPVEAIVSSKNSGFKTFESITKDISAGGAAIYISKNLRLHPDTIISVVFLLPMKSGKTETIEVDCKVIRLVEQTDYKKNVLAVQFLNNKYDDQQLLIRFCFDKQLELRNKARR
ncbi:flagellar brake protein [Bacillus massiliigorillae]|uniref:flagellar brake protein n=1 Tax=Bacillus massiliigorillae TaxID=1243664 RepID=UPI0003A57C7B|nr:flagellar brake domain-containing protein [Bacillus massiliigorillae]